MVSEQQMRWIWILAIGLLANSVVLEVARASCQSIVRTLQCPVGNDQVSHSIGCEAERYSLLAKDDSPWNRLQCPSNGFPIYRSFSADEYPALTELVETESYQQRRDLPYGALAVWIEKQITGSVDPGWHGEMLLWDAAPHLFRLYEQHPTEDQKVAFREALPFLIESIDTPSEFRDERAREMARIAYLLQQIGQERSAQVWAAKADESLGPRTEERGYFHDAAKRHIEALTVCVSGPAELRGDLCRASGVWGFVFGLVQCASWPHDGRPCRFRPETERDLDGLAVKINDARRDHPSFKTAFDKELLTLIDDRWMALPSRYTSRCAVDNVLGFLCEIPPREHRFGLNIERYFPDLFQIGLEKKSDHLLSQYADRLIKCEMDNKYCYRNLSHSDALTRFKRSWSEFGTVYDRERAKHIEEQAMWEDMCSVWVTYDSSPCNKNRLSDSQRGGEDYERGYADGRRKAYRGTFTSVINHLSRCRLKEIVFPDGKPCYGMRAFATLDSAEVQLRQDLSDFDELYETALNEQVRDRAVFYGRSLANREVRHPERSLEEAAREADQNQDSEIARLLTLDTNAAAIIETTRLKTLARLKEPR